MNTFEYSQNNLLVLPQSLEALSDIQTWCKADGSAIYYKDLNIDLLDVEFYTNQPCLVFIEQGQEMITNSANESLYLEAGQSVFLRQGQNLHSDFAKTSSNLKAWLVFFDKYLVQNFLSYSLSECDKPAEYRSLQRIENSCHLNHFFEQIKNYKQSGIDLQSMLDIKLTELLYLLESQCGKDFRALLTSIDEALPAKRNLQRLLSKPDLLKLSVADLAKLSGRSLSGFQRDFKSIYNQAPKQWLQQKRLEYAQRKIERGNVKVTDLAMEVGYDNVSHFIRAYKEKFGTTPKQSELA